MCRIKVVEQSLKELWKGGAEFRIKKTLIVNISRSMYYLWFSINKISAKNNILEDFNSIHLTERWFKPFRIGELGRFRECLDCEIRLPVGSRRRGRNSGSANPGWGSTRHDGMQRSVVRRSRSDTSPRRPAPPCSRSVCRSPARNNPSSQLERHAQYMVKAKNR